MSQDNISLASSSISKQWHSDVTVGARRMILLRILLLLKAKYGKINSKTSHIARRAELALYSSAHSAKEYRNPATLGRRLHALVVKLHMHNLSKKENDGLRGDVGDVCNVRSESDERQLRKRKFTVDIGCNFLSQGDDILRQICSFLGTRDILQCSMTSLNATDRFPQLVGRLELTLSMLMHQPSDVRYGFCRKFPNLEVLVINGDKNSHELDLQDESALLQRNIVTRSVLLNFRKCVQMRKIRAFSINFSFTDGLHDRITHEIASIISSGVLPNLEYLSLQGNCIADDGAAYLSESLATSSKLKALDLTNNYIGERGVECLNSVIEMGVDGVVLLQDNLVGDVEATIPVPVTSDNCS